MSDSWENIIGRVIDAQPFAMQNDGRRVWQLFRDDVHVGDAIKAIAALLGNSLRQVPEGLGAEVKSAALGVATIHVDQSYFGPHMIGPGMKIRIFVENPTPPTSGKCRHDFRKGTVANCIHCGECGYADPSTPLATPAQAGADQGGEWVTSPPSLYDEIRATLNRHSAENGSNTPDYVLASFLADCLQAFDTATNRRHAHYNGGQCG